MRVPIVARAYRSAWYFAARARVQLLGSASPLRSEAPLTREGGSIAGPFDPVLTQLRAEGCAILPRHALLALLSRESRAVLETTVEACSGDGAPVETIATSDELFARAPGLYLLGLDDALLEAAEAYLAAQPMYLGAALTRQAADGKVRGARHWHRDREDDRMFRVLVYLCDVGPDAGPFEYVPARQSEAAARADGYRSGYLDDRRAAVLAPPEHRLRATGAAGDAVVFDGTRIFHRASPPVRQDRLSLTLTYASRRLRLLKPTTRLTRPAAAYLKETLSARQYACLPRPFTL